LRQMADEISLSQEDDGPYYVVLWYPYASRASAESAAETVRNRTPYARGTIVATREELHERTA